MKRIEGMINRFNRLPSVFTGSRVGSRERERKYV